MTQKERMTSGLIYKVDREISEMQNRCCAILSKLNSLPRTRKLEREKLLNTLFATKIDGTIISPFTCEYGAFITFGRRFYINSGCTMLDGGGITIGDDCMFGPNVSLFTAGHPIHPATRSTLFEYCKKITIGNNVWLGGGVIVCPGVTIGSGSVIGAGSVVTSNVPSLVVGAGNPFRVIKKITDSDKRKLFHSELIDSEVWKIIENSTK